ASSLPAAPSALPCRCVMGGGRCDSIPTAALPRPRDFMIGPGRLSRNLEGGSRHERIARVRSRRPKRGADGLRLASIERPFMKTAIVTLLLGRPYQLAWHELCEPGWRAYADRHGYDIIAIDQPLDATPRAMARSPAWQKCLVLQPSIAGKYERIVWLDADIVINTDAPDVARGVPLEKVGAVDEFVYPTSEIHQAFWRRMVAQTSNSALARIWQSYLDPADYHGFWGLPRRGNHIVQTGALVLSPRHHRALLEHVYYTYENKGGPELNYEMRPLSFEIQER